MRQALREDASVDNQLRENVRAELEWDPSIDATGIGVYVERGVAVLSGHVPSYAQKSAAANAAMRVRGIRAVAQELKVRLPRSSGDSDDEIARRALDMIKWNVDVPSDWIKLVVDDGCVTLSGEVDWQFQREAAEASIRQLSGVKDTLNHIILRQRPKAHDLKGRIEAALRRSAEVEAHGIRVLVDGDRVVLEGRVRSPLERRVLERAVWAAPGVRSIDDRVEIGEPPA